MILKNDGTIYFPDQNGHFVSENQRRIAEVLQDYDPNLELQWIPPVNRGPQDYAFRIVCRNNRGSDYVVCFANECDERLLAKVFHSDQQRFNNNTLNYLDAHNAAIEAINLKRAMEEREEAHNLAYSAWTSSKIHYKHNGIDFGKPFGGRFE
jgi:hypothetical protein